jgi:hypothetical protein
MVTPEDNDMTSRNLTMFGRIFASALLGLLAAAAGARAQDSSDYDDVQQSVARISYLVGDVSYNRGDETDVWQNAALNVPVTLGDRLYLEEDARAELQVEGGGFIRLGARSDFSVLNLTTDVKQFSLQEGTASFRLRRLDDQESFEVDTPNVSVTFERAGDYRLDVDADGNTRVAVRRGQALVAAGGGQVPLSSGSQMDITGIDSPQYEIFSISPLDAWDRWVELRGARLRRPRSYSYVNASVVGAEELDRYGRWSDIPSYGRVWSPFSVEVGWQPYRAGRWCWQDPWGWTWIADEPWGWAPYHYGRWVNYSSSWYWVPVAPSARFVRYSPALVAFVGGGPGWSASLTIGGGGYVGWFPLAPRDPFIPWWGPRANVNVNIRNVTYDNRRYVTVINHDTFVSGGAVARNSVQDTSVIRQVAAAPVLRGPLPLMPAVGALRVSAREARAAVRPPVQVNSRPVVTRLAPPAAPPSFQSKMAAIREQRGAPVTAAVAAQISVESNQGARALHPVRPVAESSGTVSFRARSSDGPGPKAQAITAPRGKALATIDRPFVSTPAAAAKPGTAAPLRIAPNAVAAPRAEGGPPDRGPQKRFTPREQAPAPPESPSRLEKGKPQRLIQEEPPPKQESVKPAEPLNRGQQKRLAPLEQTAPPPESSSGQDKQQQKAQKQQQGKSLQEAPPPTPEARPAGPPDRGPQRRLAPRSETVPPPEAPPQANKPEPRQALRPAPPPRPAQAGADGKNKPANKPDDKKGKGKNKDKGKDKEKEKDNKDDKN